LLPILTDEAPCFYHQSGLEALLYEEANPPAPHAVEAMPLFLRGNEVILAGVGAPAAEKHDL